MSTPPITKRQHFVPQFYLRNFLNERNEVEVFDCDRRVIANPRGTKAICYEDYFYGIRTGEPDEVSQHIEKAFQEMEADLAKNLGSITDKILGGAQILDDEKWLIAFLMSMLWIRGPVFRKWMNGMAQDMTKKLFGMIFNHHSADKMLDRFDAEMGKTTSPELRAGMIAMIREEKYSLEFTNAQHLQMFTEFQGFANLFFGQDWLVYISKDEKFVTSDNPVVVHVPERKGFYGPTFLERTHYFALTPDICIVARYPTKDSGKKLRRKTLFVGAQAQVVELNLVLSHQAHEYAYARDRATLEHLLLAITRREDLLRTLQRQRLAASAPRDFNISNQKPG
jgi:hypothetical protein